MHLNLNLHILMLYHFVQYNNLLFLELIEMMNILLYYQIQMKVKIIHKLHE